ncbi:MAG TPA: hypothetical protein VF980_13550 [Thermoanaerobaculia bacterium]
MRLALALALLLPFRVTAQTHEHEHAHLMSVSDIGEVRFPSTCAPDAARSVEAGVTMLHSFWYDEAEKAFRHAVEQDPKCAIAYWGVAMTGYHPLWPTPVTPASLRSGSEVLATARGLTNASARERSYVDALSTFYDQPEGTAVHDRAVKYEAAMADVVAHYPDDDEAAIFYALSLNGAAQLTDKTHARQKHAAEILNKQLAKHPRHPGIIHYLIHSYDSPELAPLALTAARSYAHIAPSVPHALHMPSHIFTRLGLWDESIASNLASSKAAKEHHDPGEQLHAMDYLEYAYLQLGRFDDAQRVIDEVRAMPQPLVETKTTYAISAIPARYALERHDWRAAAALAPTPGVDWDKSPRTAGLTQFAIGVGAARSGDVERAKSAEAKLTSYADALKTTNDAIWAPQVEVQQRTVAAWRLFAEGHKDEALAAMRAAADLEDQAEKPSVTPGALLPARELLADMLAEMRQPEAALKEYKAVLAVAPNRRNATAGAAKASTSLAAVR